MLDVARSVDVIGGPHVANMSSTRLQDRDSSIKRGHTISGVTVEAGAVFEHLLRRSHSDSSTSRRGHKRAVSRQRLTIITETTDNADIARHADESTDNWTTDVTRDSLDTRLSSYDDLDEPDGVPTRSSLQSGDGFQQVSRDSVDVSDSRHSTGMIQSSAGGLDDSRLGSTQSNRYFQQMSRDSGDLLASSGAAGQHTAEASSLASVSVELVDDVTDADDEHRGKKMPEKKKKKSVFQRMRERLRAAFSRDEDRRASRKADKYRHANGEARENWLTASFRRRRTKLQHVQDHGNENGSASGSSHLTSSVNPRSAPQTHYMSERQSSYHDQRKSKGLLSSLQRRLTSIRVKRSQSRGSVSSGTQFSQSGDETNIRPLSESQHQILSRYATSHTVRDQSSTISSSVDSGQGLHSKRARLELDLVQRARPAADGMTADTDALIVNEDQTVSSDLEERVRGWDFIDGPEQHLPALQHATNRTFSEKSPAEKEELYERIASQLMTIGDTYTISSQPHDDDSAECAASSSVAGSTRETNIDLSAVTSQLLSTAIHGYSSFQRAINEAIRGESALQQIACMFHLSRAAIEHAGTSTDLAIRVKDMTIRYFQQYFAPWVVEQGGWESVVESTDVELD